MPKFNSFKTNNLYSHLYKILQLFTRGGVIGATHCPYNTGYDKVRYIVYNTQKSKTCYSLNYAHTQNRHRKFCFFLCNIQLILLNTLVLFPVSTLHLLHKVLIYIYIYRAPRVSAILLFIIIIPPIFTNFVLTN